MSVLRTNERIREQQREFRLFDAVVIVTTNDAQNFPWFFHLKFNFGSAPIHAFVRGENTAAAAAADVCSNTMLVYIIITNKNTHAAVVTATTTKNHSYWVLTFASVCVFFLSSIILLVSPLLAAMLHRSNSFWILSITTIPMSNYGISKKIHLLIQFSNFNCTLSFAQRLVLCNTTCVVTNSLHFRSWTWGAGMSRAIMPYSFFLVAMGKFVCVF